VFQGKYKENDKSAQKGVIWKFLRISRISEVNRDTSHYLGSGIRNLYEDFEIIFRIPIVLSANHHFGKQIIARGGKNNFNFHFIFFPLLLLLFLFLFI
jgi:hypothetical protein